MRRIIEVLTPFVVFGVLIAFLIVMLLLVSYLIFWGILIGAVLFTIAYIKNKFFPNNKKTEHRGITIEHESIKPENDKPN